MLRKPLPRALARRFGDLSASRYNAAPLFLRHRPAVFARATKNTMQKRLWEMLGADRAGAGFLLRAALITALVAAVTGSRYFTGTEDWAFWQYAYFFVFLTGHVFVLTLLFLMVPGWPLTKLGLRKCAWGWAFAVIFLGLVLLVADTFVFQQFRLHINLAMLELTLLGGGQIVAFSPVMLLEIAALTVIIAFVSLVILKAAAGWSRKGRFTGTAAALVLAGFAVVNLTYAVSFPLKKSEVLTATDRIPYAQPLRMTKVLLKTGVITQADIEKEKTVSVGSASGLDYPKKPLVCTGDVKPMNIVFLFVDALRSDVVTPENMPQLSAFARTQDTSVFTNHHSGGNATRTGIFSVFYGLPGPYWFPALSSGTPSALITALQKRHYAIGTFTGAPLTRPEFHATVFSGEPGLRLQPRGATSFERDRYSVDDFIRWRNELPKDKPFFSFIFLDAVHACAVPDDPKYHVFKPFLSSVNQLTLTNDTDPVPYFNRYRNSAYWTDGELARVTGYLKEKGLLENTIVVVSSDHGEEFNDNKLNYWGHNGNYTDAQIKVPLIVHWPGKAGRRVDAVTSSADLTATLIPEALGCANPTTDYTTGESLWSENRRKNWFHSASYSSNAFVEPERIVLINKFGMLEFQDKTGRPAKDETMPAYLKEAVDELTRWKKR